MIQKMHSGFNFSTPRLFMAWGEVIDKLTILEIKLEKLTNSLARQNVKKEWDVLFEAAKAPLESLSELDSLKDQLSNINRTLWHIEDDIRLKEFKQEFDNEFIQLARSVYIQNDERARIKKRINLLLDSTIIEEKSYTNY